MSETLWPFHAGLAGATAKVVRGKSWMNRGPSHTGSRCGASLSFAYLGFWKPGLMKPVGQKSHGDARRSCNLTWHKDGRP